MRSVLLAQPFRQESLTAAAHRQPRAVPHDKFIPGSAPWQFANPIQLYDGGSMDSDELTRVQTEFERCEGLAQEIALFGDVNAGIVVIGADPVDFSDRNHYII
jgi:hypothetical protein